MKTISIQIIFTRSYSNNNKIKIPFKLGKLNHVAIATRDIGNHLNFFGNVLGAEIGPKLVISDKILMYIVCFNCLNFFYSATTGPWSLHNFY